MSDPFEQVLKEIELILREYKLWYIEKAEILKRIEPKIKTYGEQCVRDGFTNAKACIGCKHTYEAEE